MNFDVLREALRQARHQAAVVRKGVQRVGMTLKEAAAATGLNISTIHGIENVRREPALKPELDTIERLSAAYGLTLSSFFARIEDLPTQDEAGQDHPPPPSTASPADDEAVPALTAEEIHTIRALTKVIRQSADREQEAAQSQSAAHHRHAADPHRSQAAPVVQIGSDRPRNAGRRRLKKNAKLP